MEPLQACQRGQRPVEAPPGLGRLDDPQLLGGQDAPEVGGDVRRRGLLGRLPGAVAAAAEAVGRQPAGQGHGLERPPGVAGVTAQRLPLAGAQLGGIGRRRVTRIDERRHDDRGERAAPQPRTGKLQEAGHEVVLTSDHQLRGAESIPDLRPTLVRPRSPTRSSWTRWSCYLQMWFLESCRTAILAAGIVLTLRQCHGIGRSRPDVFTLSYSTSEMSP